VWLSHRLHRACTRPAGSTETAPLAGMDALPPVLRAIAWFSPGDGNPGAWYVLEALPSRRVLHAFQLCEVGRRVWRVQVYTSDARFSFAPLTPRLQDKLDDLSPLVQYQSSNRMGSVRAGVEAGSGSVVVMRGTPTLHMQSSDVGVIDGPSAGPTTDDNGVTAPNMTETLVERRFLTGIVPACLLDGVTFWLRHSPKVATGSMGTGDAAPRMHIVGIPQTEGTASNATTGSAASMFADQPCESVAVSNGRVLDIELQPRVAPGLGVHATLRSTLPSTSKQPAPAAGSGLGDSSTATMVLLDACHAPMNSVLARVANWAVRLDLLSHVLVWSMSNGRIGDEVSVDLIEFPRLGLSFRLDEGTRGSTHVRWCSVEHTGLFVSDVRSPRLEQRLRDLPHGILLCDTFGKQYVAVVLGWDECVCERERGWWWRSVS